MKSTVLAVVLLLTALPSFANSIDFQTFAFQDNGLATVALGQGLDPLLVPEVFSGLQYLVFGTSFGAIGHYEISATLNLPNLQLTSGPFEGNCTGHCIEINSWAVPASYEVTPGILSVTLNGVMATYDFKYQSAIPEPTTLALLGTGLMAGFWRKYSAG